MRALPHLRPATAPRAAAVLASVLALGVAAPAAQAHGGTEIIQGGKSGVTVSVSGVDTETESGGAAVDISTIMNGPGTGEKAVVDYWVRTAPGKKSFKVETDRDAGGTYHVDISTSDRGDWRSWDLSAIVTLSDGKRLRVTNASGGTPPGPAPSQPAAESAAGDDASTPAAEEPKLSEGPSTPDPTTAPAADGGGAPIEDISGEESGPPSWAYPSLGAILILGAVALFVTRRRREG